MVFRFKIQKENEILEFKKLLKEAWKLHKKTGQAYAIKSVALTNELKICGVDRISIRSAKFYHGLRCLDGIICALIEDGHIQLHQVFQRLYFGDEYWESFIKDVTR